MGPDLRSEPQDEAAAAHAVQVPRGDGAGHRVAGERNRNCGAEFDALGALCSQRQRQERVMRCLERPRRRQSHLFELRCFVCAASRCRRRRRPVNAVLCRLLCGHRPFLSLDAPRIMPASRRSVVRTRRRRGGCKTGGRAATQRRGSAARRASQSHPRCACRRAPPAMHRPTRGAGRGTSQ